jgi:PiT family inorganic phosphate transporter
MDLFTTYGTILIIMAAAFGFFMAWGVGANDVANAMGTSVGSKALTIKQAILIAMVFEFAGAYLAGGEVTSTIRKGIVDSAVFTDQPDLLVFGMLSALLAAGTWLAVASFMGWPVSTTHSIVGAIVGFAAVGVSYDAVNWNKVSTIVASWVVSPVMAGTISFAIFRSVQRLILIQDNPFDRAKKYAPMYMFAVGFLMAMVTLLKGLKHVFKDIGIKLSYGENVLVAAGFGILVAIIGTYLLSKVERDESKEEDNRFYNVEKVFAVLMIFTACSMAFAHGSNDVANAVGPLAAVVNVVSAGGDIAAKSAMPSWILLLGGAGIVVGLATYGFKVMGTIGRKITELTPSRGFAAELGAAATVVLASGTGLPISTTHTLGRCCFGRGNGAGNWRTQPENGWLYFPFVGCNPASRCGAVYSVLLFL